MKAIETLSDLDRFCSCSFSFRCLRLGDISGELSDVLSWDKHTVCPLSSQLIPCVKLSAVQHPVTSNELWTKRAFKLNLIQGCCSFSGSWLFQLQQAESGLVRGAETLCGAQWGSVQAPCAPSDVLLWSFLSEVAVVVHPRCWFSVRFDANAWPWCWKLRIQYSNIHLSSWCLVWFDK